ncbi:MAG: hypothetical protein P1Q69_19995, partial [Candidatus Thorarchaeota archaeon]|nr:hypothetical protein [Candidatus Thorarchaeota archaeon]
LVRVVFNPPPLIDSPDDLKYTESLGIGFVEWHPSDEAPDWYYVYVNATLEEEGQWIGSSIRVNVSGYEHGVYNITLVVRDMGGKTALDSVFLRVVYELNPPLLTGPLDLNYVFGDTGNVLSWNSFDEHPYLSYYYVNGALALIDDWVDSILTYSVDGYQPGVYNITLVLYDMDLNNAKDEVTVTVETIPAPEISSPEDMEVEQGEGAVSWTPSSQFPSRYEVYVNETLTEEGVWDGSEISFDTRTLLPGMYNITLVVYDQTGNSSSDTVWLRVNQSSPMQDVMSPLVTVVSVVAIVFIAAAGYRIVKQGTKQKDEEDWRGMLDDFG